MSIKTSIVVGICAIVMLGFGCAPVEQKEVIMMLEVSAAVGFPDLVKIYSDGETRWHGRASGYHTTELTQEDIKEIKRLIKEKDYTKEDPTIKGGESCCEENFHVRYQVLEGEEKIQIEKNELLERIMEDIYRQRSEDIFNPDTGTWEKASK